MSFKADNHAYEKWLRTQCDVVEKDLDHKHHRMKKSAFIFLRATFFRWAGTIKDICPQLAKAPVVLSVGDVHVENFGTWRDAEGRLVWGLNDFDEASDIPYPFDLVRLATSAFLVPKSRLGEKDITEAILAGYRKGLAAPRPTLLAEQNAPTRAVLVHSDHDPDKFWHEVDQYPPALPPSMVADSLRQSLPHGATVLRFATCVKGGGSLGRPRYVAIAHWRGGHLVREAKALVPSAWDWAQDSISRHSRFLDLARGTFRAPDPFLDVRDRFIVRRIAADSQKSELGDDPSVSTVLLGAMAADLAAIHAADSGIADLHAHLAGLPADWLHDAARKAKQSVEADYAKWTS